MSDEPRIAPLAPEDRDQRVNALLEAIRLGDTDLNLFTTLAHHPRLLRRWSQFGGLLLFGGTLPHRDREVLILRTAANTGTDYEWGHHVAAAEALGVGSDAIAELAGAEPDLSAGDILLVTAADELHADGVLSDETWSALTERYDRQQIIELCMLVGQYHMVGFTVRSLGVQLEDGFEGIPCPH